MVHRRILRTVDANINRVSEGLRVLEDISRFIVEDASISSRLKSIRHNLHSYAGGLDADLIEHRNVPGDIGAKLDLTDRHGDLTSVARANAKRVEEGLRVLEELAKLPALKEDLPAASLKEARYQVYSIEQALALQLERLKKSENVKTEKGNESSKKRPGQPRRDRR